MAGHGSGRLWRAACAALMVAFAFAVPAAGAAQLDGVVLPDMAMVGGVRLYLNGLALRTYSLLRIPIYVAGLYLQQPSHDAEAILDSPEEKMLVFRFLHNVDAKDARNSWREGFAANCRAPCYVDPTDEARFLAAVPAVRAGEWSDFLFSRGRLTVTVNGQTVGTIANLGFERAVLASFLGPRPPTKALKRGLLGGGG